MSFRDNFIDGYWLTPVGRRQRTFAQWSLEHTVDSELRANQKQLQSLRENLSSVFQAGIARLEDSQIQAARLLQRELQYQADHIVDAIDRGAADVVSAVQNACDYLGGQLCEVRWAIERHTQVSHQILQVLLNALDNTSRQYWEQGVKCYETSEYEIARERFGRALDANRTNYFAYQYLGFIAVHDDDAREAIRYFELARKFADSGYHRALALSHLARSHHATGDLSHAVGSAKAATEAAPEHAKFWYECAVFHVRGADPDAAMECLRRAISLDWTYWSISISDANLDHVRPYVERLLAQMREEQRVIARQTLDGFTGALKMLQGMQLTTEVAEWHRRLEECEASYREGTVFAYRNLVAPARDGHKQALQAAAKVLDQRIAANRAALAKAESEQKREVYEASSRVSDVESRASRKENSYTPSGFQGCLILIGAVVGAFWLLAFMVNDQTKDRVFIGKALLVSLAVAMVGLLWIPVMRFLIAKLPASSIRAQLPELRRNLERVKADSEARLARETARLNEELHRLKQHQERCQQALARV